jgi:hypothetical protein
LDMSYAQLQARDSYTLIIGYELCPTTG